jgi:hypothetical protein
MAEDGRRVGFEADVKPLFRSKDRESMLHCFDLWSREDVLANGDAIVAAVKDGRMPCDGSWASGSVELLEQWVSEGGNP